MSVKTTIEWTDSTLSLMASCDFCELWNPKTGVRKCYAGVMIERYKGKKGWPVNFATPTIFPERITQPEKWSDLTGTNRTDKPWLNGMPRIIFHNDMGDMWSESLALNWFDPYLPRLAALPHINILLTKRPQRMAQYFADRPVPHNFWLCTSITNQASVKRIEHLTKIEGAYVLGLSIEPLWEDVKFDKIPGVNQISWAVIGGESGSSATPCDIDWIRRARDFFLEQGAYVFIKQLGTHVIQNGKRIKFKDYHGGDWEEWPADLRVRQMPKV